MAFKEIFSLLAFAVTLTCAQVLQAPIHPTNAAVKPLATRINYVHPAPVHYAAMPINYGHPLPV